MQGGRGHRRQAILGWHRQVLRGSVGLVKNHKGNFRLDQTGVGSVSYHNGWVGVVNNITEKLRRICEFEDQECTARAEGGETGNDVVGAASQQHADEAVSANTLLSQAVGKKAGLPLQLRIRQCRGLVFQSYSVRRRGCLFAEQRRQVLVHIKDRHLCKRQCSLRGLDTGAESWGSRKPFADACRGNGTYK
ncbi:hypothetical protein PoMZ_07843 [Pyricularia oryzae]|uniref:Uncharacterized protein n=1 Tax=Pyricularia oryzae TaxID=318829 RepID=A0A4P7NG48_PYROR|nr:hypothetical protein PoMZ_07843 [Pyricularia oryzae]